MTSTTLQRKCAINMTDTALLKESASVHHWCKIYSYPQGFVDIIASSKPDFLESGWEEAGKERPLALPKEAKERPPKEEREPDPESVLRSQRRARAQLRRAVLATEMTWFVTLTLDQTRIDRYDMAVITKHLSTWANNRVKRDGLAYVLVPERHKDGAIHFHGFFNGALEAVPSGHCDKHGHPVYNLPDWPYGFTRAIPLYGDYRAAVAYCCKYIGKGGEKIGGRWWYHGGCKVPRVEYADMSARDVADEYGDMAYSVNVPGRTLTIVNGYNTNGGNLTDAAGEWEGVFEDE